MFHAGIPTQAGIHFWIAAISFQTKISWACRWIPACAWRQTANVISKEDDQPYIRLKHERSSENLLLWFSDDLSSFRPYESPKMRYSIRNRWHLPYDFPASYKVFIYRPAYRRNRYRRPNFEFPCNRVGIWTKDAQFVIACRNIFRIIINDWLVNIDIASHAHDFLSVQIDFSSLPFPSMNSP